MRNGGAVCTAANWIYVHKNIATEFTKKFAKAMSELKIAPGRESGALLGASVSIEERNKIAELVELSVKGGAVVETGGVMPEGVSASCALCG